MNTTSSLAALLKSTTYELCRPEGRVVGTPGHATAERYVALSLAEIGCRPYRGTSFALPYRRDGIRFTNFAGVIPGKDRSLAPLLVGAHYDSVIEAPCADDNGAAVSICLAIGRQAEQAGGFERDLIIAIFDAEEPPHFKTSSMGSIRFAEDQLDDRGVHFAMIYDLVGHDLSIPPGFLPRRFADRDIGVPFLKDLVFVTGAESHPELPALVGGTSVPGGLKLIATLNEYVGDMSDHGIFRRNGVPYLFFSCGRWQHYHQVTDTPDRLNYRKMARLTGLSMDLLSRIDAAGLDPFVENEDPVEFEADTFRRSLGLLYPGLLRWAKVRDLGSRQALDQVSGKLMDLGL
jgi:hypothetical protein